MTHSVYVKMWKNNKFWKKSCYQDLLFKWQRWFDLSTYYYIHYIMFNK